jgi:outer membrane protein assembly factor BamB
MATLEVHDGQGRVQFIDLESDQMILFGTSASCEIILEGPEIKPVHGRIRLKGSRVKVEPSPDAGFVILNGRQMVSGSIGQGDEITVGPCRIFVLRIDEAAGPGSRPEPTRPQDGKTRVMPPPAVPRPSTAGTLQKEGASTGKRHSRSGRRKQEAPGFEVLDELEGLGEAVSIELPGVTSRAPAARPKGGDGLRRLLRRWIPQGDSAPGRENIASSPLVLGLVAAIVVLVGMGFWLKSIIAKTIADRTFNRGIEEFEDGDYRTAIRDLEGFIASYPEDRRVPKARVIRAFANVRQYVSPNGATWTSALEAARQMLEEVGQEEEFRDQRVDLAELVIRIGEGLADRARHTADAQALSEAESSVALHAQVAGEPAQSFLVRSRLPGKLAEARAAVRKSQVRKHALAEMDLALQDRSATRVYDARDRLVDQYSDLAHDKELIARMTSANELIRKAVTVDTTHRPASRTAPADPLGPATSVVMRTRREPPAETLSPESIVFALAEGFAYGLESATGAPLWQVPVGLASPFVPQPVAGEAAVIAFDARLNELVRLDSRNGALAWRLDLRERVTDPPLVLGNQLAQVLPSGKLLLIALETGELQATVNLGRPLARQPVHDESGRHLYVLGRQDCLFILTRDPLVCSAVEYLGHLEGSIPCAPARLGRFLVIPENDSLKDSIWQILVLDEDGGKARPVQELKVTGWTWQTPAASGQIIWATGDKAGFEAFAVGDYAGKTPFRSVARLTPDASPTGPAFAIARSERELWVASGHPGKFALDLEHGGIQPTGLTVPGPALAPIQSTGKLIVATFQDRQSGGVALWGIEPESINVLWKTVIGAPWPAPLSQSADSLGLTTYGRDGQDVPISSEQLSRGGFVVMGTPRPGELTLPPGLCLRVERDGKVLPVLVPRPYGNTLWVQDPGVRGGWREVALPAPIATDPIVWADALLIPGADGRIYLIDPTTGRSRAEPYVPQFDRDREGAWRVPAAPDRDTVVVADEVGRVRRLGLKPGPVPRLNVEAETLLDSRIIGDPACTGSAVLVATADRRIRSLALRDLSPVGAWQLEAPIAGRPVSLGDGGLAMDRGGGVMAFGRDGQRIWSIKLGAEVVGAPQPIGRSIAFLTGDGVLHLRARSDGAPLDRRTLGVLPSGGLLATSREAIISVAPGTIRPLALQTLGAVNP